VGRPRTLDSSESAELGHGGIEEFTENLRVPEINDCQITQLKNMFEQKCVGTTGKTEGNPP
jgi:hypothetical protein